MRKWLSIMLVRLATWLYPENLFVQEFFMKVANEEQVRRCFKGELYETNVVTTWEEFRRGMERKRGFYNGKYIRGVRRGIKTVFTFATYGDQVRVLKKQEFENASKH